MTYEDVVSLGWVDRYPNSKRENSSTFVYEAEGFDYHIMSVHFGMEEDDGIFDLVIINCVPKDIESNEWENSETHFYGQLKTKQELDIVMQLVGITKYAGL